MFTKSELEQRLNETIDRLLDHIERQDDYTLHPPVYEAYDRVIQSIARQAVFLGRELNKLQ